MTKKKALGHEHIQPTRFSQLAASKPEFFQEPLTDLPPHPDLAGPIPPPSPSSCPLLKLISLPPQALLVFPLLLGSVEHSGSACTAYSPSVQVRFRLTPCGQTSMSTRNTRLCDSWETSFRSPKQISPCTSLAGSLFWEAGTGT